MLHKVLTFPLSISSGLPAAQGADPKGDCLEERGLWRYLVTDAAGIRPRLDSQYGKESKSSAPRFSVGTIVEVVRRRRSGWTRWLEVKTGEGWLFDVSPKDRKVRLVEVEVQYGEWLYEVLADKLPILSRPQFGAPANPTCGLLQAGDSIQVIERVRPLIGRGAFLRIQQPEGWIVDFLNGGQTVVPAKVEAELPHDHCDEEDDDYAPATTPKLPRTQTVDTTLTMNFRPSMLGEPELGNWWYVTLDPRGITVRSQPTYDKGSKLKFRLPEGELVKVVERRSGSDTRFLRIEGDGVSTAPGWAFEQQPGSAVVRMTEATLEEGAWYYYVVADRGLAMRSRLTTSFSGRVGEGPKKGAVIRVGQRARVGRTTFLRLKDGSGWVFDMKDGRQMVEGPLDAQPLRSMSATVLAAEGVQLLAAPCSEASWAQTKRMLLSGAKVNALVKVTIRGNDWIEVLKPGTSMQGWVPAESLELDNAVLSSPGWAR